MENAHSFRPPPFCAIFESTLRATGTDDTVIAGNYIGLNAAGTVGVPNVALGAIEDELRLSGADEVIVSTHPPGRSNWLETGIVDRLRAELDIPVTHLVAEREPAAA